MLLLALLLVGVTPSIARADIAENQTLLLWNSEDWESSAIKVKYVQLHPGILTFDLDIEYTHDHDNEPDPTGTYHLTDIAPDGCGITKRYITPCKFRELFLEEGCAFMNFLAANPNILCIATTRGLPAAISDSLSPFAFDPLAPGTCCATECAVHPYCLQPGGHIYASFEAALTRLRYGSLGAGPDSTAFDTIKNPYAGGFGLDAPGTPLTALFDCYPFDAECCGDLDDPDTSFQPLCPGEIFAVSRLDSAQATIDYDLDGDTDNVDGVLLMLVRSQHLRVNKYAVSAIYDCSPGQVYTAGEVTSAFPPMIALWNGRWCYLIEEMRK